MKTFQQFKQDMTEGVAALAIPAGVGILKKIATSSALKYAGAGALTGAGYLASKKISDMSDDEIKNPRRKKRKIPRGEQRLRDRENNVRDNDMIRAKEGEIEKQNKMIDNYEIIKQELQKRLDKGAEGKFRRGHSGKFQQSDSDLKKKIDEIGKKIKDKKNPDIK